MTPDLLPLLLAGAMAVALNAYMLLGGADFGGGVWDLFAGGPRRDRQRQLIAGAIGPIWEANHVWLILVLVLLFTCFPAAFAALSTVLHIPLTLMLIGIVLRGSAFVFRAYDTRRDKAQRRWGRIFSIASAATPVLLGMCVGAVASGRAGQAVELLADSLSGASPASSGASFAAVFVRPWLSPFTLAVGAMALSLFAFLATVYLTLEARHDRALQEDFRRRALAAAGVVFAASFAALLCALREPGPLHRSLTTSPWAVPFHVATGLLALAAVAALLGRRYRLARLAAAAQTSAILWGWAIAQYPDLVPGALSLAEAAAPPATLRAVLWALAAGALLLVPSLAYLFRVFRPGDSAFAPAERPVGQAAETNDSGVRP
jgi:cytochrome bd ubiquinol oxidase subunit II